MDIYIYSLLLELRQLNAEEESLSSRMKENGVTGLKSIAKAIEDKDHSFWTQLLRALEIAIPVYSIKEDFERLSAVKARKMQILSIFNPRRA